MQIAINPPKVFVDMGITAPITYDTDKGNDGGFVYLLKQGLRYTASARASHTFSKIRGPKDDPTGVEPTREDGEAVLAKLIEDLHAPEWPERERAEREAVSLEDRCWEEVLEPRFTKAGVLRKGRKAREATPAGTDENGKPVAAKPAVEAREAVTVLSLMREHGGAEGAFRAVNREYLIGLRQKDGKPVTDEWLASVEQRSTEGFAKAQKEHAALLKLKQKMAAQSVEDDADSASL